MKTVNLNLLNSTELTPAVIKSVTEEILQSVKDILEMYEIEGTLTSLELGLLSLNGRKSNEENFDLELSFTRNEDFALTIIYSKSDDPK